MLYPHAESAQSIISFPEYQREICYEITGKDKRIYAISPVLINGTMPFVVARVDTEYPKDPANIAPYRIVEYQYGILPTNYSNCYEIDNEQELEDAIEATLGNFVRGRSPFCRIYVRSAKNGSSEMQIKKHDFTRMGDEGPFWLQVCFELSGTISKIVAKDKESIEKRVYPASTDSMAIKKYRQLAI